jgi:hypothetical protein
MSEPAITIVEQVQFLVDQLNTWSQQDGRLNAKVDVVPNMEAAWAVVSNREGAPKILVMVDGEDQRANFSGGEVTGMEDRAFSVVLSRGRGLKVDRGAGLTEGVGGGVAFLQLLDDLVELVRSLILGTEKTIYYRGFDHFGKEFGLLSDSYRIRFAVGTLRPMYAQF